MLATATILLSPSARYLCMYFRSTRNFYLEMKVKDVDDLDEHYQANLLCQRAYVCKKNGASRSNRLFAVHIRTFCDGRTGGRTLVHPHCLLECCKMKTVTIEKFPIEFQQYYNIINTISSLLFNLRGKMPTRRKRHRANVRKLVLKCIFHVKI